MSPRTKQFLVVGGLAGALWAPALLVSLGTVPAPKIAGYCLGASNAGDQCDGADGASYFFPGPFFGIVFMTFRARFDALDAPRFLAFVAASGIGNAVAVLLCVALAAPLTVLLNTDFLDIPFILAGAISGAAGGGLLSGAAARLIPGSRVGGSVIAATLLRLLVPLVPEWRVAGNFPFYVAWQAGCAPALGAGMPQKA